MRVKTKKCMLGVLAACSCLAITGGLAVTQEAKAENVVKPNFYVEEGAEARLHGEESGIRFYAYIEKGYYDALTEKKVTVSVNKAENPVASEAMTFTFENFTDADLQDGYYVMKASIIYNKLTPEQTAVAYPMELAATASVTVGGETVYATNTDSVRSMRGVALSAIANGETNNLVYRYIGDGDNALEEGEYTQITSGGAMYYANDKLGMASIMGGVPKGTVLKEAYANAEKLDFDYYYDAMQGEDMLVVSFKNADLANKEENYLALVAENGNVYNVMMNYTTQAIPVQKLTDTMEADYRANTGDTLTFTLPMEATMGMTNMSNLIYKVTDGNGTEIPVTAVSGNTFTVAKASVAKGDSVMKITMYGQIFEISVYVADLIIKTETDLQSYAANFSSYLAASKLVALGADIKASAYTTLGTADNTDPMNATPAFTFDGRGYSITGYTFYWGIIGHQFNGTLKNLALVNCTTGKAGRGVISTKLWKNGVVENVYIKNCYPDSASSGVAFYAFGNSATDVGGIIKNCVIDISGTTTATDNFLTANAYCYGGTITNVYGVGGKTKFFHVNNGVATTVSDNKIYADSVALGMDTAATNNLVNVSSVWTVKDGGFYFGDMLVASVPLDVEYDIDLSDSVENYQIDLTKIGDYKAADVTEVTLTSGTAVTFSAGEGSVLNVAKTSLSSLAKGMNGLTIKVGEKTFIVKLYVADLIIYNNEDLVTYNTNFTTYSAAGKLIALGASFDASACTALGADSKTNTAYAKHTLDGRGYVISNLSIKISIMGNPQSGTCTVKNLGLINPTMTSDAGTAAGVFFDSYFDSNDIIENCYVKGLTSTGANKGYHNLVGGHNGNKGGTFKNVVVDYSTVSFGTDNYTTGSVYSNGGTLTNFYGVGAYTKFYHGHGGNTAPTLTNCKAFTTVDLLLSDMSDGNAAATLAGNGAWNVKEGKLYFGSTVIGTLPAST